MSLAPQADRNVPLFTRYGLSRTGDPAAPLELAPYPEICAGGVLRMAVLAATVDIIGSLFARTVAGTDATFTTDLSVRAPARFTPDVITTRGQLLRAGRSAITSAIALLVDGAPFAYGETSFTRAPRPGRTPADVAKLSLPEVIHQVPLQRPLVDEVGIQVADAATGRVELPLRDTLRNPEGVMQGALVGLLAEVAAESLARHDLGHPQIVEEIDIRYLATGKVGPITCRARWVGEADGRMIRAQLRDRGNGDRVTAAVLLRVADAPQP